MSIYADAKYKDVPDETKQALFDEVKADMRYEHQLYGCYECEYVWRPVLPQDFMISVQGYLPK